MIPRFLIAALALIVASPALAQTTKKISELTAGTPPYAAGTLFELSVPSGASYVSRSGRLDELSFTLGSTSIGLSDTVTSVTGLTLSGSTWNGNTIPVLFGGTGQTSYTNGQLLIGNTTGNTLAKGTLTAPASGISITNGAGSITFALTDDLLALEGLSTTGLAARTGSNAWSTRTITGTANRLSVSNGDGVSGNPTLDISASYVGQNTITTLGTIATGVWNGTAVVGQYGGTGVANTGKTITLGGNLVTSGAFATTLTVTNTTDSTLPAGTHTLAGLDVAQTWSANQQFNSGNFLLKGNTSGTLTVQPAAVTGTNTLTLPAGTTDFSATGGSGQFVKQASAGAAFTVSAPTIAEIAGLGANVATFLGTPSSANLASAVTDETGSGALVFATSPTLATPTITDPSISTVVASTVALSKTNDTFATPTGLSVALQAGKTYICRGHLFVSSSGAAGGIKATLAASGGLTATSVKFTASNFNGTTTNARSTATTLGTAAGGANAEVTDVELVGSIVVNVAGTLNFQAAQNTTDGTATVIGINSNFGCIRTN